MKLIDYKFQEVKNKSINSRKGEKYAGVATDAVTGTEPFGGSYR